MSAAEVIVRLFLVAGLASYLYLKHYQRVRQRSVRQIPPDWDGKCLDVSQLKPAIENVRRDYQAAQTSPRRRCHHQDLLELAKHAVLRLAYFQHGNTSSAQIEPCPTDKPTLS